MYIVVDEVPYQRLLIRLRKLHQFGIQHLQAFDNIIDGCGKL